MTPRNADNIIDSGWPATTIWLVSMMMFKLNWEKMTAENGDAR